MRRPRRLALLLWIGAWLLSHSTLAGAAVLLKGKVVGVTDGDTIVVLDASRVQHRIRLAGIDAPERSQAFGQVSKRALGQMVFQREADVFVMKTDRYGRSVGRVVVGGKDVCLEQIRSGLAWFYAEYEMELVPPDRARYSEAMRDAKRARRGLWSDPHAEPPWVYRRSRRGGSFSRGQRSAASAALAPPSPGRIIGNLHSHIYHLPDCPSWAKVAPQNRVYFESEAAASAAGFQKARNCP